MSEHGNGTQSKDLRRQFASVLARKIEQGQYSLECALDVAKEILYETLRTLCGMKPRPD